MAGGRGLGWRSSTHRCHVNVRLRSWFTHWGPLLPLLVAEATVWLGFGALLPILSIYFVDHGVDLPMLGVVVAAWPAARIVSEPVFGWVADRVSRKTMMVAGLLAGSVVAVAPLLVTGTLAFIALRMLAGVAAAMYDPAARGYLVDANPAERRGEAFGLYNAAQMGGFMLGPAVGGVAAGVSGNPEIVFWVAGVAHVLSAIFILRIADRRHESPALGEAVAPAGAAGVAGAAGAATGAVTGAVTGAPAGAATGAAPEAAMDDDDEVARPTRLVNRLMVAAVVLNVGAYFAGGCYEVIWSLYMTSLGASVSLIGVSFFSFSLPVLLLSPFTGRYTDRRGGFLAMVLGMAGVGLSGALYVAVPDPWYVIAIGVIEGVAFSFASPALYLLVARASPAGRSSTAQGLFGAAGTVGTIVASVLSGILADVDLRLPYLTVCGAILGILALGLLIGRRPLYVAMQPAHHHPSNAAAPPKMG